MRKKYQISNIKYQISNKDLRIGNWKLPLGPELGVEGEIGNSSHWRAGFTLIELLIVFSVIAFISTVGIAAFVGYSRTQSLNSATSEAATILNVARSRSLSQVKPSQGVCSSGTLEGYRFDVCGLSGSLCDVQGTYELNAMCSGNSILMETKSLPTNISFDPLETAPTSFLFKVISGAVDNGGKITIVGYGQKRVIVISAAGTIQIATSISPTPTLTPTQAPTFTPTPTLSPTPTPTPTPSQKRIFVTSGNYKGDLGGLSGADSKCQARAQAANLGGTWRAWISDNTIHAKDRINDGKYIGMDNKIIANNKADLVDGAIQNKIDRNELNNQEGAKKIWTGTNSDGSANSNTCSNWTSASDDDVGVRGKSDKTNANWTSDSISEPCDKKNHLYCFEQ